MKHGAGRRLTLFLIVLLCAGCAPIASQTASTPSPVTQSAQQAQVPVEPQRQPSTVQAISALGAGDPRVGLLVEPDDSKRRITQVIRHATHSLDLVTYLLTDHTIIHDLEYAHARGVQVRVILEPHPFGADVATRSANQSAYDQLYAADIPVQWSIPRYTYTHQKTMIVDGTTAYILTLNYTKSAFTRNREFGIIDTNRTDVREAEAIFSADWNNRTHTPRDPNLFISPINSRAHLLMLLARAHHTVDLYAEEVQDTGLEDALTACAYRHVRVRLISNAGDARNAPGIARLQAGGVQVHLLKQPYIHAKVILVDRRWAFVGSENLSPTSLDHNRELGVLIGDPIAIARLEATFVQDWGA